PARWGWLVWELRPRPVRPPRAGAWPLVAAWPLAKVEVLLRRPELRALPARRARLGLAPRRAVLPRVDRGANPALRARRGRPGLLVSRVACRGRRLAVRLLARRLRTHRAGRLRREPVAVLCALRTGLLRASI